MRSSTLTKFAGFFSLILFSVNVLAANPIPNLSTDQLHITGATASTVPVFDVNKKVISSAVTPTQLAFLSAATDANTASTLVKRDGSGNFFAGTITATFSGNLTGNVTGNVSGNAGTVTTNANLTGPITSTGNATAVAAQTGTGTTFVMQGSPTLTTPNLGTPSTLVGTNISGTAASLTAGTVTTNANLTGPITSSGNATAVAAQTGTGTTFVMQGSPTLTTPNLGTPSTLVGTNISGTAASLTAGTVTTNANLTGNVTSVGNATTIAAGVVTNAMLSGATSIAKGGTNNGSLGVDAGGIVYTDGSALQNLAHGTSGNVLTSGGTGAPTWTSPLINPMNAAGQFIYGGTAGAATALGAGTTGQIIQSNGASAPTWINGAVPAGTLIEFAASACPTGYLAADGTTVSRTTYAVLWAAILNTWGNGDGSTTFTLPDLRGRFARGLDSGATNDPDRTSRTAQTSSTFTVGSGATISTSAINVATGELAPGMSVTGTDIPANSVVRSITDSTHFVLGNQSNSATVAATGTHSGITFTFSKSATANYVGTMQAGAFASHTHRAGGGTGGSALPWNNAGGTAFCVLSSTGVTYQTNFNNAVQALESTGGNETRPLNADVLYCIRTGL